MVRLLRSGQTVAKVYGNLKRKVCTEFADYISTKNPFSEKMDLWRRFCWHKECLQSLLQQPGHACDVTAKKSNMKIPLE